jgi:4'-phosphopantetheinyl transferase
MVERLQLPLHEAHLWHLDIEAVSTEERLARYQRLLTEEERARHQRYHFEEGKRQYLLTRALVRTVLSAYAPEVAPESWRFGQGAHGRPFIREPNALKDVSFNLSNTRGQVVCLVARGCEVGVDVELRKSTRDLLALARRFFSERERVDLEALDPSLHCRRFYEYWTLKESYIKARGMGLAIPLDQFSFTFAPNGAIQIQCDPALSDEPRHWQFFQGSLSEQHALAGSLLRGDTPDREVIYLAAVPLEDATRGRSRAREEGSPAYRRTRA